MKGFWREGMVFFQSCPAWVCCLFFFGGYLSSGLAQQPTGKNSGFADAATKAAITTAAQIPLPAPSASARDLFSRYKDRLVQVRVLRNSANEQSSLGSGFVVRDDGPNGVWLLTNYHVISSLAIDPEKFRIELRPTSERTVKATLVAVDVIHDLALLRSEPVNDALPWKAFAMRETALSQGERIFSLGNPLELGFLISEGIYNGLVESQIYEQMLFSGALNSGMSGGPTIDETGRVVGVNVATHRGGVLLSFLVPVRYASDLLDRAMDAPLRKEWRTEVARQLLVHQNFVAGKLLNFPTATDKTASVNSSATVAPSGAVANAKAGFASQTLSGRNVPTLDGSLTKCWAGGRDGERLRYQRDTLNCTLRSDLFVRGNLYTGSLGVQHVLLRNDKLATAQFLAVGAIKPSASSFFRAGNRELTPDECRDDYVRGTTHVYRVAICLKAFRKFEGIYNFTVNATQVDDARERLTSTLTLNGFSFDNGQRLSRMFLERLQ